MSDIKPHKTIAVRQLVEFIFREGDIGGGFAADAMLEGARLHRKIQKSGGDEYEPEVYLKYTVEKEKYLLTVEGRADGVITEKNGECCIDEIKSVSVPLESIDESSNFVYWAQVMCYAFILSTQKELEYIDLRLSYCHQQTEAIRQFRKRMQFEELNIFFSDLIDRYGKWVEMSNDWTVKRNCSLDKLIFPFDAYRPGQRELAAQVYITIRDKKRLFVNAPTGIGKTISTLFPALKALGLGHTARIFYLSARTINRDVVDQALVMMRLQHIHIRSVMLTAKEKICINSVHRCNALECQFAKGHYDRVNDALWEILNDLDAYSMDSVREYALKYQVCPFELSLDCSLWCDVIVGDYNYVFDPLVYLKRFFADKIGNYTFLVDEAHNLVDRARSMFSTQLVESQFQVIKKKIRKYSRSAALKANRCVNLLNNFNEMLDNEDALELDGFQSDFVNCLRSFIESCKEVLGIHRELAADNDVLTIYFEMIAFLKISDFYDERYVTYIEKQSGSTAIKLFCLDPSYLIQQVLNRGRSSILFSATLLPSTYFKQILGGESGDKFIIFKSPFNQLNRQIIITNNISVRFTNRNESIIKIVKCILSVIDEKLGNYLVFFPSYSYMMQIYEIMQENSGDLSIHMQSGTMTEPERMQFLENFKSNPSETTLGFCVLGGLFSEGIDLKAERCIGVFVIGVGLPLICFERDLIRNFFQNVHKLGFDYAYRYPGMNKVLQAAGRLIRSENDKGIIILIDDRYIDEEYQTLFPQEWFPNCKVHSDKIALVVRKFWDNQK